MERLTNSTLLIVFIALCFTNQLSAQSDTLDSSVKQEFSEISFGDVSSVMADQGIEHRYRINLHIVLVVDHNDAANLNKGITENRKEIEQVIQNWFYTQNISLRNGLPGVATMRRELAVEIAAATRIPCFTKIRTLPITRSE